MATVRRVSARKSGIWGDPAKNVQDPWKAGTNTLNDETSPALAFGKKSGLALLGRHMNDLMSAMSDPAGQIEKVNQQLEKISETLGKNYREFVEILRERAYPDEQVEAMADEFIRPQLRAQMALLREAFPHTLGGGPASPFQAILNGLGGGADFNVRGQLQNVRALQGEAGIGRSHKIKKWKKHYKKHKKRRKTSAGES